MAGTSSKKMPSKRRRTSFTKETRPALADKGRPPGSVNKVSALLKDRLLLATEECGNFLHLLPKKDQLAHALSEQVKKGIIDAPRAYMVWLGLKEPKGMTSLMGRLLPLQLSINEANAPRIYRSREEIEADMKEAGIVILEGEYKKRE